MQQYLQDQTSNYFALLYEVNGETENIHCFPSSLHVSQRLLDAYKSSRQHNRPSCIGHWQLYPRQTYYPKYFPATEALVPVWEKKKMQSRTSLCVGHAASPSVLCNNIMYTAKKCHMSPLFFFLFVLLHCFCFKAAHPETVFPSCSQSKLSASVVISAGRINSHWLRITGCFSNLCLKSNTY